MAADAVLDWLLGLAAGGGVFLRPAAVDFASCVMGKLRSVFSNRLNCKGSVWSPLVQVLALRPSLYR